MAVYKYTKGLSTQDLLNIDPSKMAKMGEKELREAVSRLGATGNKRLKRGGETPSPIVVETRKSGKFTTSNKDLIALRNEYMRVRLFLTEKTSTVKGWKDAQADLARELKKEGWTVKKADIPKLYSGFLKLTNADPSALTRGERYKYLREAAELVIGEGSRDYKSAESIFDSLATALQNLGFEMGDSDATRTFESGVSEFFELQ